MIKPLSYVNFKLNDSGQLYTKNVNITYPDGTVLGGIDHYKVKSVAKIISYYIKRLQKEKAKPGNYTISIETSLEIVGPATETTEIILVVS